MEPEGGNWAELLKACRELHALPQALTDTHAHAFFSEFPFDRIFRSLTSTQDQADVSVVSDTLGRLLATELGSSALSTGIPYLDAASGAPLPPLRYLAAEQYGSFLMSQVQKHSGNGDDATHDDSGTTTTVCLHLIRMLSDTDTTVAAAASRALRMYGISSLAALQQLLSPGAAPLTALAAAAASDALGGVVRLRVLALALELAAGGGTGGRLGVALPYENGYQRNLSFRSAASGWRNSAASHGEGLRLLRDSGLLQPLLDQLANPTDALARLAALQLLEDLLAAAEGDGDGGGDAGGGGMAAALAAIVLPQLLALVSEPSLADATLPLVAGILRRTLPAALPAAALVGMLDGGVATANGETALPGHFVEGGGDVAAVAEPQPALAVAPALLMAVRSVLDDRGDASAAAEACGLDALGTLGQSSAGALLVLSDDVLVRGLCERALGRSPHPEVRMAALHALASVAGLERGGRERAREAALLPVQCEEALRRGVYAACGVRRPAEVLAGMLQQPFLELRLAVYRHISALSLRNWFAVEVITTPDLYDRITDARSESSAAGCNWRYAAVAALSATVSAAAVGAAQQQQQQLSNDVAQVSSAAVLAAAATLERVRTALRGGPYGADTAAATAAEARRMHEEHFVASRGAGGGL